MIRKLCAVRFPVNFAAYLQIPPRHIIYTNFDANSNLRDILSEITAENIREVDCKKQNKMLVEKEKKTGYRPNY